ncbi:MAG: LysM peptidoglycan-binding domain-containing protein [Verrucomicrobia bacterium]|nr:LysM peptidoglycan-binding domain-containing protein [Verrucomicrobiota bacterium]
MLILSLAVNVVLGITLLSFSPSSRRGADETRGRLFVVTNTPTRIAKTNILLRSRLFSWQDLESSNYDLYVLNLRGIGCPESTVRDIILADVNQVFARRRQELNSSTNDPPWWRSEPDPEELRASVQKAQALEEERRKLLTRLLGPNWEETPEAEPDPVVLAGPALGLLSAEQKQTVQDIVASSRHAVRDYIKQCRQAGESPDPAALAKLREETRRQLEQHLSPLQLEEFLLRYSSNASQLREELRGFNATPEEFRKLFQATDALDRQLQLLADDGDPATAARRRELEQQREKIIRESLDADRYDAYRALRDNDYKLALMDAQEAGAPAKAGRALYEINHAAAAEKERLRNDPNLTPEEMEEELKELEQQRLAARADLLGQELPPEARPKPPPSWQHNALPGETLEGLSLLYRVPLSELLQANPGLSAGNIPAGQNVKIPPRQTPFVPPQLIPTLAPRK